MDREEAGETIPHRRSGYKEPGAAAGQLWASQGDDTQVSLVHIRAEFQSGHHEDGTHWGEKGQKGESWGTQGALVPVKIPGGAPPNADLPPSRVQGRPGARL